MTKLFVLMMLCLASSVSHAQKIKYEYDEAGNVVKRHAPELFQTYTSDNPNYQLKVSPIPTTGPLHIKFYEGRTGNIVNCRIQVIIHPAVGNGASSLNKEFNTGDFTVDISNFKPDIYALVVLAYMNPQGAPVQTQLKFEKK